MIATWSSPLCRRGRVITAQRSNMLRIRVAAITVFAIPPQAERNKRSGDLFSKLIAPRLHVAREIEIS